MYELLHCPRNRKNNRFFSLLFKWEGEKPTDFRQGYCKSGDLPCVLEKRIFEGMRKARLQPFSNGDFTFLIFRLLSKVKAEIFFGGVKMKRKLYFLVTFILAVLCFATCFIGCKKGGETTAKLEYTDEHMIVMSIEATDGKATAFDALTSLKNQNLITFEYSESTYGAFIESINGVENQVVSSTEGYYWEFFTSDEEYAYETPTETYDGVVCGSSSQGASSVIVKKGQIYIWKYNHYSW